jgi:hypothetical protein
MERSPFDCKHPRFHPEPYRIDHIDYAGTMPCAFRYPKKRERELGGIWVRPFRKSLFFAWELQEALKFYFKIFCLHLSFLRVLFRQCTTILCLWIARMTGHL